VFSAVDGAELGRRPVPPFDYRWTTLGRRVLTWNNKAQGLVVQLLDPWHEAEPVVWTLAVAAGSKAYVVENEDLAILEPDGKFAILGIADGAPKVDARLELGGGDSRPPPILGGIIVTRTADQYFVAINRPVPRADATLSIQPDLGSVISPLVEGPLYAFDRRTGEPSWPSAAYIDRYGLPLEQPADVPVLTFLRQVNPLSGNAPARPTLSILCLDKRSGRVILDRASLLTSAQTYEVVGNPGRGSVDVRIPNNTFTITFTDKPRPPEPPAQTGEALGNR
jgi:hypothetical protein